MNPSIPHPLQSLVAGYDFEPVTLGESSAQVFRLCRKGCTGLYLKIQPINHGLQDEAERLKWLSGRVRIPAVLGFATKGNREFLLTEALPGHDATKAGADDPESVVAGMANELRIWHAQPVDACPFDQGTGIQIERAKVRARNGLVDENNFDKERLGRSAMEIVDLLEAKRPATEDHVLTHGDPCLPNVIFHGATCSGFIDCGRSGVADPYQDLALAARSIQSNLGAKWVQPFFDYYGLPKPDEKKLSFYRLLDEFF